MRPPRAVPLLAIALLLGAGLAGCLGLGGSSTAPATTPSTSDLTTAPPDLRVDGAAALEAVRGFALRPDGTPRYRIPGTEGQREGAEHLWQAMAVAGWSRHWQNFTGEDYAALDRSPVSSYLRCDPEDEARVPGYTFHNLYAIRPGPAPDSPLVLLAAHWDSLVRSFGERDPERRAQPYPGANDGASGVGLLLHLMHELEGVELPFAVGVLFLDGEDGFQACYPLAGSLHFAQNPPVDVDRVILLDMVGSADARFVREAQSVESDPALVDLLWEHGRAHGGADAFTDRTAFIADDHVAFIHAGIPAVDVIDAGRPTTFPPEWHTLADTVDTLSAGMLGLVGTTLLATLHDPRFVADWPGLDG